ncbi:hypothetical protein CRV08_10220 [Halarcobacter ebronensis]|uniref:Uncharacterized protein n=1 Tax=Halarcobacter ebronensis TaxID=1462615 RepID=A0A4Q0YDT0_9BACT|nr:hypothetical protein [Halarcobacter ebronensis]RXJ67734.1 hypothetical protein CRV08_10220 [Halarcobacter ebronensis]
MAKISLDIDDKKLPIVLNILENLKAGLIDKIEVEKSQKIKPVSSSLDATSSKKYLSKQEYKKRVQQKVEMDEFLPKNISTSKYLSAQEFKNKLKGK